MITNKTICPICKSTLELKEVNNNIYLYAFAIHTHLSKQKEETYQISIDAFAGYTSFEEIRILENNQEFRLINFSNSVSQIRINEKYITTNYIDLSNYKEILALL